MKTLTTFFIFLLALPLLAQKPVNLLVEPQDTTTCNGPSADAADSLLNNYGDTVWRFRYWNILIPDFEKKTSRSPKWLTASFVIQRADKNKYNWADTNYVELICSRAVYKILSKTDSVMRIDTIVKIDTVHMDSVIVLDTSYIRSTKYTRVFDRVDTMRRKFSFIFYQFPEQISITKYYCGGPVVLTYPAGYKYEWRDPANKVVAAQNTYKINPAYIDSVRKKLPFITSLLWTVAVTNPYGCIAVSHYTVKLYQPLIVTQPEICVTTTDSNQHHKIQIAQPDALADSLIVETYSGNTWQKFSTIYKKGLLDVTYLKSKAAIQSYSYRVTAYAYDSCAGAVVKSLPSVVHKTILLQVSPNPTGSYNLSWNKYEGISDSELLAYRVWKGTHYSNMQIVDTTASIANNAWVDPDTARGVFVYLIEAIKMTGCDTGIRLKKPVILSIKSNSVKTSIVNSVQATPRAESGLKAELINGRLRVNKPGGEYMVINTMGQIIDKGKAATEKEIKMQPGINFIVVTAGGETTNIKVFNNKTN